MAGLTRPRQRPGRTTTEGYSSIVNQISSNESDTAKLALTAHSRRTCPSAVIVVSVLVASSLCCAVYLVRHPSSSVTTTTTIPHMRISPQKQPLAQEILTFPPEFVPSARSSESSLSGDHQLLHHQPLLDQEKILTLYLEPPASLPATWSKTGPLSARQTTASKLTVQQFPDFKPNCRTKSAVGGLFPVDDFTDEDPFLPWIHDYFVQNHTVRFVAQNKRRCDTGEERGESMRHMEPQIALFQPVPVRETRLANGTVVYQLTTLEHATTPETRFICRFHNQHGAVHQTLSAYPFNYEYVAWRKHNQAMYVTQGRDVEHFEYSQLLFYCPIPAAFQTSLTIASDHGTTAAAEEQQHQPTVWLDVVPIRTPARQQFLFTEQDHTGPKEWPSVQHFDAARHFSHHVLPAVVDSGRWANLPLCPAPAPPSAVHQDSATGVEGVPVPQATNAPTKKNRFVACTWTAASYHRRGDAVTVEDSAKRLKEWIVFHRLVGLDHLYIYDNTAVPSHLQDGQNDFVSPVEAIANEFPGFITLHPWPFKVCNNNRPNHKNPGERSSQYAAEASCRERYGPDTDWLSFIDTDEFLVPMRNASWESVLQEAEEKHLHVLKMRSSRGKPRTNLMEVVDDPNICYNPQKVKSRLPTEACIVPRHNETFLRVYNCDYIRPPRPERFARAMKQIYRPAFVKSHFVHYSTITADIVRYYRDTPDKSRFTRRVSAREWGDAFLDELAEGVLVHTKSVLPYETMARNATCQLESKHPCAVGYVCPDSLPFDDKLHQKNVFHDDKGKYCNCWTNSHVEDYLVPKLEAALALS